MPWSGVHYSLQKMKDFVVISGVEEELNAIFIW